MVVKVVGTTIKAVLHFHSNLTKLDFDAIKQGAKDLGISFKGGIEDLKLLLKKATDLFNAVIGDSTVGNAVTYYLDGMMESMSHVSKFKLAGGAVFTIGLEVLLFLISGGAANAAKWGAQVSSKTAKTAQTITKADFFGPFPVNTLEIMADFGSNRQAQIKSKKPEIILPIKVGESNKITGKVADTKPPATPPTQLKSERDNYDANQSELSANTKEGTITQDKSQANVGAESVVSNSSPAAGPVNFMEGTDRFFLNASKRPDIDPDGSFDVVAHGSPNKIQIETPNGPVLVDHRTAAKLIEQQPGYNGQNIRLLSCSTGACDTGFAQNLSNKLNVEVQAPTDLLWAYPDGKTVVAPRGVNGLPNRNDVGEMKIFLPKQSQ